MSSGSLTGAGHTLQSTEMEKAKGPIWRAALFAVFTVI